MSDLETLIDNHLAADQAHITENDVAALAKIRPAQVEVALQSAVAAGRLRRVRVGADMAYTKPQAKSPAPLGRAAQPAARKRGFAEDLPPLDIEALPVRLEPLADGRAVSQPSKWTPLFERLAKMPPSVERGQEVYPTIEMPAKYGKAVSAAARKWAKQSGAKVRIKVMSSAVCCKVQRVA